MSFRAASVTHCCRNRYKLLCNESSITFLKYLAKITAILQQQLRDPAGLWA